MKTLRKRLKEMEERNLFLSCDNLRMRLDFEVLIDGIESKAAQIILERYRRKRTERNESSLATQN